LWIGLVITAQAFQASPLEHAPAVAIGLVPSLAAWLLVQIETTLRVAGSSLFDAQSKFGSQLHIHGVIALSQGFLLTSIIYAAVVAFVIDRKFTAAALWMLVASAMSAVGLLHAYQITPSGVENHFGWFNAAPAFAIVYAVAAGLLFALGLVESPKPNPKS
jgi:AGZA family xanthine/uracil permease-like MFS transporter